MQVGDLVKICFGGPDGGYGIQSAVILKVKQEVNAQGFVENPDCYAFEVAFTNPQMLQMGEFPKNRVEIFEDEVEEVISESR